MFFFFILELETLKYQCKDSARHAYAQNTYKNLKVQLKSYFMFCIHFEFEPLPTSVMVITLYAQFLSRSFKSVESIRNYISAVKSLHLLLDLDTSSFETHHLKLVLRGLSRLKQHCPKQALPITPQILYDIYKQFDITNALDVTMWCLFLHAFFLMFRKSNLVPDSISSFDNKKQLTRGDITFHTENVLLFKVRWSKTIQFGEREVTIPLVSIPGSPLCPVQAFLQMTSLVKAEKDNPAYCLKTGKQIVPITYRQFQKILKGLISKIGLNPKCYSTHSFRRGGASWAFASDIPSELIQLYGDWKSDAYKRYLKFNLKDKIAVANKMSSHIASMF